MMLPVYVAVSLLKFTPAFAVFSRWLAPAMKLFGLPGEAAMALVARGIAVEHIFSETHSQPHSPTPWAQVEGERITYPPALPEG